MTLDQAQLRNLTARALIRTPKKDGFTLDRQSGSHQLYYHPDGRRITVVFHSPGDTFKINALKVMIELHAKWTETDLRSWVTCRPLLKVSQKNNFTTLSCCVLDFLI
jgi:predicted RNA binding protein YcfA (HicA-like mRNA interferase family)